jgi:hypothetical protein
MAIMNTLFRQRITLVSAAFMLYATAVSASVRIPPAPSGYPLSARYEVRVNGRPCPVFDTRVFFELNTPDRIVSFAQFDCTGAVKIEVVVPREVKTARIRPASLGLKPEVKGNRISFTLRSAAKLSVEINGGIDDNLHLFVNRPEENPPKPGDANVLYYGPGIHHVDGGPGILRLKTGQTLYLAPGAVLRARLLAENASNIRICGRGILEGTTLLGRQPDYYRKYLGEPDNTPRSNFVQFNRCKDIVVEGVILNDPPAWTLVFNHCERVRVTNVKEFGYVDNSDGVDVVSSRDVVIEDFFSRVNDDCVAIKSHGADVRNVEVRDSVLWSDRAVGLQIGHETISSNIAGIIFRNIDILEQRNRYIGHYAMGIFNGDHATVSDVLFDNIRVENCERLISLIVEKGFFNQSKERGRIENIRFRDIRSDVKNDLHLYGFDENHAVRNIAFERMHLPSRDGEPELFANFHAHGLAFMKGGAAPRWLDGTLPAGTRFTPLDIGSVCNRSRVDELPGDGQGCLDLGPDHDLRKLPVGLQTLGGVPFRIVEDANRGVIVLRSSQRLLAQPYASYPIRIDRKITQLFFLHGTAFTDAHVAKVPPEVWIGDAGKLRFNQSPTGTPLWHYLVRYADTGEETAVPVKAGCNVEDWEIWAPGGWVVPLCGKKFYIQQWNNPHPDRVVDSVKVMTALRPEVPMVLGVTMGVSKE